MCAKYYENPTMLSRVMAKNVGDVFLRHTVVTDLLRGSWRRRQQVREEVTRNWSQWNLAFTGEGGDIKQNLRPCIRRRGSNYMESASTESQNNYLH